MPIELPKSLVEQLPVAALFVLCAAVAGRYAARLVDRLVAAQQEAQAQLILVLERNTAAWRDTCAALARLELAVAARSRPGLSRRKGPALSRREGPGLSRREGPALSRRERPARPRKEIDPK
jgi:hypothetical protein